MLDRLDFAPAENQQEETASARLSNSVMDELRQGHTSQSTNDEPNLDLVGYRITPQHARNLCNGLNQLQNEMCLQAWKRDGYRTNSELDTHETFGEMWAREEREMRSFERKHHYRPLDPRAPWNQDPSRLNADRTVRCLGPNAPKSKGDERYRCSTENSGGFW